MTDENKERDWFKIGMLIGFIVQIILIGLKVIKFLNWAWWIIMLPFEIYFGTGALCCVILMFIIAFKEW